MPRVVEEFIYPAMEDFRIDIVLGEGINARTISMRLKRFTLIGATTRSGMLSSPMRDRFKMHEHLEFYSVEELAEIVRINAAQAADRDHATTPPWSWPAAAGARRASPTPGCGGRATTPPARPTAASPSTSPAPPWTWPRWIGEGLDKQDRRYLETLIGVFEGGPTGVEALAATMNLPADTLSDEIEPYLLREQFIVRTPRGRRGDAAGLSPCSAGRSRRRLRRRDAPRGLFD